MKVLLVSALIITVVGLVFTIVVYKPPVKQESLIGQHLYIGKDGEVLVKNPEGIEKLKFHSVCSVYYYDTVIAVAVAERENDLLVRLEGQGVPDNRYGPRFSANHCPAGTLFLMKGNEFEKRLEKQEKEAAENEKAKEEIQCMLKDSRP